MPHIRHSRAHTRHSRTHTRHSRAHTRHSRAHTRHSREGGNPVFVIVLDPRLRGDDGCERG